MGGFITVLWVFFIENKGELHLDCLFYMEQFMQSSIGEKDSEET